jgi:ArsR family transcriptional regulator, arsenate/arsenite/antimonite-responsive transcriptional repressor / arsenate reductase (thioredoxin)
MANQSVKDPNSIALEALKLLADDTRWKLIQALRHSDRQANELAGICQLPNNLVSYHLNLLRQAGLIQVHRSDADARVLYYGLDLLRLGQTYQNIGAALPLSATTAQPLSPPTTVVFLCTHNSARSQMAEGWLRYLSGGKIIARSAGVNPTSLHPVAVQVMQEVGVDIGYQHAKGLESLGVVPDVIVTVCDVAREQCPAELERVPFLHWSVASPVRTAKGTELVETFRTAREQLRVRVQGLVGSLPELLQPKLAEAF